MTREQRGATRGRRLVLGLMIVTGVGCGDPATDRTADGPGPSPFTVDLYVEGYRAVTAGTGTEPQVWGDDTESTHEPYTALRRRGTEGLAGVVIASVTGYEGQQGGLSQSAPGSYGSEETFSLDGRDAIYSPPSRNGRRSTWADLVVDLGHDLAVRVTTPEASREQLVGWFERVQANGRERPPSVEVGDDLELIGTVGVEAAIASRAFIIPSSDLVPGPESAFGVGWIGDGSERRSLALVALRGDTADLDALAVGQEVLGWRGDPTIEVGTRDGRDHLIVEETFPDDLDTRAIWIEAPNGDLLMVRSVGDDLPSRDELFALLDGAQPADDETWEALVVNATGGPGLHPDEGREEIARGSIGEVEWLLQTASDDGSVGNVISGTGGEVLPEEAGIDQCLKLSNRHRACGSGGGGSNLDWIYSTPEPDEPIPGFVVLSTTLDAASVCITTRTAQVTAPLHQVPGRQLWGAVVFVDDPGNAGGCDDYPSGTVPPDHPFLEMRVDALDAAGNVVGCLGFGPGSHEGGI